jgi:hypothetical protein
LRGARGCDRQQLFGFELKPHLNHRRDHRETQKRQRAGEKRRGEDTGGVLALLLTPLFFQGHTVRQGSGSEPMNVPQLVNWSRCFGPIFSVAIQTELFAVTAQE